MMFLLRDLPEHLKVLHLVAKRSNDMANDRNRRLDEWRLSWIRRRRQQSPAEGNYYNKNE
jgi:hypothetical protein